MFALVADPPGWGVGATPTNVKIATLGATTKKRLLAARTPRELLDNMRPK